MVIALSGVSLPIYFTGMVALSIFVYGLDLFDGQFVPWRTTSAPGSAA